MANDDDHPDNWASLPPPMLPPTPSGVITFPGKLTDEEAAELREKFRRYYSGTTYAWRHVVMNANERAAQRRFIRRMGAWAMIASTLVTVFAVAALVGWLIK